MRLLHSITAFVSRSSLDPGAEPRGGGSETQSLVKGNRRDSDQGSILILALIFIVVAGLTVVALASMATTALSTTAQFLSVSQLQSAARSTTNVAINSIRYTPLLGTNQTLNATPASYCWGTSAPSSQTFSFQNGTTSNTTTLTMDSWCATTWNPQSSQTRVVTIDTCPSSQSVYTCENNPYLQTQVTFDDYPTGVQSSAVSSVCNVYCGQGLTVDYSNWSTSSTTQLANTITVSSSPPSNAQVGGAYVPVATATSGQAVVITSSPSCPITSGTVEFTAYGPCTITFSDQGNISYLAAIPQTQTFDVGYGVQSALTLATTNATSSGSSYSLVLSTNGGSGSGLVSYSLDGGGSATACAINGGSLTASSAGTCIVSATKAADSSYTAVSSAATSVTFSLASQTAITIGASPLTSTTQRLSISGGSVPGGVESFATSTSGCSISGTTLTSTSAACLVNGTLGGNAYYQSVTAQQTVTFSTATSTAILATDEYPFYCQNYGYCLINFTVTVTGVIGEGIPSGTVSVYQGSVFLCSGSVQSQSGGNATTAPYVVETCNVNLTLGTTYHLSAKFAAGNPSSSIAGVTYTSSTSATETYTP
ncbi:MAG TPA: hypothetical protein VIJ86_02880 [Acidimicrobiales bacterium]